MSDPNNMRAFLMDELKNANKMLAKYETKLLDGENPPTDAVILKDGLAYWRAAAQQLRGQIFDTKSPTTLGSPVK